MLVLFWVWGCCYLCLFVCFVLLFWVFDLVGGFGSLVYVFGCGFGYCIDFGFRFGFVGLVVFIWFN